MVAAISVPRLEAAEHEGYLSPDIASLDFLMHPRQQAAGADRTKKIGYIGEAKVCTELVEQRTKEQLVDYSKKVKKTGDSETTKMPFFIAIPHDCNLKMTQTLKELHLDTRDNIHVMDF